MERIVWAGKTHEGEGWGSWRFREDTWVDANPLDPESKAGVQNVRVTQFLPLNIMREWGVEEGKAYRITVEEIDHPCI